MFIPYKYLVIPALLFLPLRQLSAEQAKADGIDYVCLRHTPRENVMFLGDIILSRSVKLSFLSNVQLTYVATPNEVVCGQITDSKGRIVREGDILARAYDAKEEIIVDISNQKVKKAKQILRDASLKLKRIEKLYKQHVFSERQHEEAENEYLQAASDYDVCRLELLEAKENLENKILRAPFSGIVENVYASAGSSLPEDKSILVLSVFNPIRIRVKLHDIVTDLLCVHNEFRVYPTGLTSSYPAWLETREIFTDYIELTAKNLQIPKIKLTPEEEKLPKIYSRMRAIRLAEIPDINLWVPAQAIRRQGQEAYVWKLEAAGTRNGNRNNHIAIVKRIKVRPRDMFIQKLSIQYQALETGNGLDEGQTVLVKTEGELTDGGQAVMYDSCWLFQPGEKVWVSIPQLAKHVYLVPSDALRNFENRTFIFIVTSGSNVLPIEVFVHGKSGKNVEIIGKNLFPGMKVVCQKTDGMFFPGDKVKLGKKLAY
ncbi:MAG: hypothetical protein PHV59_10035 [Victivallales bacterium]|nr:hypothetical protein [Victivallales bacterium]